MDSTPLTDSAGRPATSLIVGGGIVALAAAMGIGRFAFTPLMPLMLRDGTLTAAAGAEWAAANYVGYLLGALTAPWFSRDPRRGVELSLFGVAATTLAPAWIGGDAPSLLGIALRGGAGVFSAWALVCASGWCLGELAARRVPRLGAWIYVGVGLGITLAGVLAWIGGRQPASRLWLELGLVGMAAAAFVALLPGRRESVRERAAPRAPKEIAVRQTGHLDLVACYGAFGFGYILPATFLPAMAREQVSDPLVFGLTWPLFGLAGALSVAAAARWLSGWPRRRVWALAQGAMTLGTAFPLATQALWSLAASAIFVGGTFMVVTMAGLQFAREQLPANPTPLLARMTVAFALGQIAGPLLVRLIGDGGWTGRDGLALANAAATAVLAISAAWLWRGGGTARRMPAPPG